MMFCNSASRKRSISNNMKHLPQGHCLVKAMQVALLQGNNTSLPEIVFFLNKEVLCCTSLQARYLVEMRLLPLATVLFTYKNLLSVADSSGEVQG